MAYFKWGDDLSVGSSFIDHDHRRLIRMVNELHTATSQGKGREVVGKILSGLLSYTREHFQREEHHMQQIRYSGLAEHKQEHEKLLEQVVALQQKFDTGNVTVAAQVSRLLRDWLSIHIMQSDKRLAAALKKVQASSTHGAISHVDQETQRQHGS